MPSRIALLDASVLVPASLCDTLLRAADAGLYSLAWSDDILDEVRRSLVENGLTGRRQADRRIAAMRRAFPAASVVGYQGIIPEMTNAPDDRHVLAAAVTAGARVIVTSNLRHFPAAALGPHNVVAQSPDDFLLDLFAQAPATMLGVIVAQAAALRRPAMPPSMVLGNLASISRTESRPWRRRSIRSPPRQAARRRPRRRRAAARGIDRFLAVIGVPLDGNDPDVANAAILRLLGHGQRRRPSDRSTVIVKPHLAAITWNHAIHGSGDGDPFTRARRGRPLRRGSGRLARSR